MKFASSEAAQLSDFPSVRVYYTTLRKLLDCTLRDSNLYYNPSLQPEVDIVFSNFRNASKLYPHLNLRN